MIKQITIFILTAAIFFYFGEFLDMLIFRRSCSSSYGSYAYLISFLCLIVFAIISKRNIYAMIYIGIPLLGLSISTITYNILKSILIGINVYLSTIVLQSTYCFFVYVICGFLSIVYVHYRSGAFRR